MKHTDIFHDVLESDWKMFRKRLPDWQERHMEKLLREYAAVINGDGNASTKFWTLEKRLRADVKHAGVCVEISRSSMIFVLLRLVKETVISAEDLDGFSDELKQRLAQVFA
jgi:hypothetical protein